MTNSKLIAILESVRQPVCACEACKSMCRKSPCFPTPQEAKKIIDAGFGDKLALSVYQDRFGAGKTHVIISGAFETQCAFLNDRSLCELHDLGLKPLEGRIAYHAMAGTGLREAVCRTWYSKAGYVMLKFFYDKYISEDIKIIHEDL